MVVYIIMADNGFGGHVVEVHTEDTIAQQRAQELNQADYIFSYSIEEWQVIEPIIEEP